MSREVDEDRVELGLGPGGPDPVEPLGVLLLGEPADGVVLGELARGALALGVADAQVGSRLPGLLPRRGGG